MLPPLEGEIKLKDETAATFDQVVANASKANQALKGAQDQVLKLEEVFTRINVRPDSNGGFFDLLSGKELVLDQVLQRALNADNLGSLTYRQLATQIKAYVESTETASSATTRLSERLEELGPPKMTAFEKLDKRLKDVKKDLADLDKDAAKFQDRMKEDKAEEVTAQNPSIMDRFEKMISNNPVGAMLQNLTLSLPGATRGMLTFAGALGTVAASVWEVNVQMDNFLAFVAKSEVRANNMGMLSFRLDTQQVETELDKMQMLLDRRISEQDLATILLKIDPRSALASLDTFAQVAKTVQGFADKFGLPWQEALDQVTQAIQRNDGQMLEHMNIVVSAQDAYNDYARQLGKTTPQLTDMERQQALINRLLDQNAGILLEVATNADISRGAGERFTAQWVDMKTALEDFLAAWADNRFDSLMNWFAGDETMGPGMANIEKFFSDMAGNERIRKQLSDQAEANFDHLLAERDRIAAQITDLTAEMPKAEAAGDEQRVAWLKSNIQQLETRMKAIDASVKVAREDVYAGRPVTPLPVARDAETVIEDIRKRSVEVTADYELQLVQARQKLAESTHALAQAEAERAAASTGDATQQMVLVTYETELAKRREALQKLDTELSQVQQSLANPPTVAFDPNTAKAKADALASQVGIINQQVSTIEGRVVQLNNANAIATQVATLTERIQALRQSDGNEADVQRLLEDRTQRLQIFLDLAEKLRAQGIEIAPPNLPIEETTRQIDEQAQHAYSALQLYKTRLTTLNQEIQQIQQDIAANGKTTIDHEAVAGLDDQLTLLTQKRSEVQTQIAALEQQIAQISQEVASTPEAAAAAAAEKQAQLAQNAAQAQVDLLSAERDYLQQLNQVEQAAASGNVEMWEHAQQGVTQAQEKLHAAYQAFFSANANDADSLLAAQKRLADKLGPDFLADIASGKTPVLEIFKIDDISKQAQDALAAAQKALEDKPLTVEVDVNGDGVKEHLNKLLSDAQSQVEGARVGLMAAYQKGDDDAIKDAQNARTAAAAQAEQAIAAIEYARALENMTAVQREGNATTIASASLALQEAEARYLAANAAVAEANTKTQGLAIQRQSADSMLGEAAALELIKIANEQAAQAESEHISTMQGTTMVAGVLVDSVSGLPLAFNAAEMSAKQLGFALVDLETQMQNMEAAAISAGFSIANRLIPVMGLAGSLQQAGQWAQQARGISDTFNQINQNRMGEGKTPLGTEVLTASMDALRQNWNAMAQDSVMAMRKVDHAASGGASAMEQAVKRMDSALDGMIQGVLQDSTKGLIPLDKILPREDVVDEKARRMADVAVKGYQSPWFEGLKDMFPQEILDQGEGKVKESAAHMVRDHQQGLTTMFYDTEMAANKVLDQLQAKANLSEFIAGVREKVKEKGKDVKDLDIMEALGIDVSDQKMAGAAQAAQKTMSDIVPSYEEIINQLTQLGEAESPIIDYLTPSAEGTDTLKQAGTDAASTLGDQVVQQTIDGGYGTRAIDTIINQMKVRKEEIQKAGRDLADWLGTALTTQFKGHVPSDLLDILVVELIPLMAKSLTQQRERGAIP